MVPVFAPGAVISLNTLGLNAQGNPAPAGSPLPQPGTSLTIGQFLFQRSSMISGDVGDVESRPDKFPQDGVVRIKVAPFHGGKALRDWFAADPIMAIVAQPALNNAVMP